MPITTTSALPGFYIAAADSQGNKTARETKLTPGPTRVEYPNVERGEMIDTADGRVVVQVSSRDPRRRSWIWVNYSPELTQYERQYRWFQQLNSRTRLSQGLPPYVWVYDGLTGLLNVNRTHTITSATQAGTLVTVPTLPANIGLTQLRHATLEILDNGNSTVPFERRSVLTATSTTLTIDTAFSAASGTSSLVLSWSEPAWWKARILDTTRELRSEGGMVRYTDTKLTFVIDEEMPN